MDVHQFASKSLGRLAYQVTRGMHNALARRFRAQGYDITVEQWRVIMTLMIFDGSTQSELCEHLGQEKTGISRLLAGLEKKNYLVRVRDRDDARIRRIHLSHKARANFNKYMTHVFEVLDAATEGVSERDLDTCRKVLEDVLENLRRD